MMTAPLQVIALSFSRDAGLEDRMPFCPHPHAGFGAVTYVLEDSPGDLRSRASSGIDIVGPGGIVWTHAGNGVVHDEVRPFRAVKCTRSRSSST
jgi:redox-sensitive bicupin YhaK (pirin superfamily)